MASTDPLQVSITASPNPALPGQLVTFTLKVTNPSSSSSPTFTLRASVPNGSSVAQAQAGGGGCSGSVWPCQPGQEIDYYPVTIGAGATSTFQFSALLNSASPLSYGSLVTPVVTTGLGGGGEISVIVGTASSVSGPASATADAPVPLWALGALGAGLFAVGRTQLRPKGVE